MIPPEEGQFYSKIYGGGGYDDDNDSGRRRRRVPDFAPP
jgi:hypothetical protein